MKGFRNCAYLALAAWVMVAAVSCRHRGLIETQVTVTVQNCTATPSDNANPMVHTNYPPFGTAETLIWQSQDNENYTAVFSNPPFKNPPYSIPAKSMSDKEVLTTGTVFGCSLFSCDYSYQLQKQDKSYCPGTFIMHVKG